MFKCMKNLDPNYLTCNFKHVQSQGHHYPLASSTLAIIVSVWLNKSAYDGISGEDTDQMSTQDPWNGMKTQKSHKTDCCQNDVYP